MKCQGCQSGEGLDFDFSMAFQPIYDVGAERVWGYEALVRGLGGEGAMTVLSKVTDHTKYRFDQACRVKALQLASQLFPRGSDLRLSINFMPNAVYEPAACLKATLSAAAEHRFPLRRVMFEFTESEAIVDTPHLKRILGEYRRRGFTTALDDFGAGYAGLGLLADFQPDLIKIDMHLVRGIDTDRARRVIVGSIVAMARDLDIQILAEGIETQAEFETLKAAGIRLFQGYWFARPSFQALPPIERHAMEDGAVA